MFFVIQHWFHASPYILFLLKNSLINDRFFSARSWERFFCCSSLTSTSECTLQHMVLKWRRNSMSKENCDVTPWKPSFHHSPYDWLAYRENHTRDDLTVIQRHTKKILCTAQCASAVSTCCYTDDKCVGDPQTLQQTHSTRKCKLRSKFWWLADRAIRITYRISLRSSSL